MDVSVMRHHPAGLSVRPRPRPSPVDSASALLTDDLIAAEVHLREMLGSSVPVVQAIGTWLADAGGKRLRPLLTGLGARAAGNTGSIARLMCAGELLHLGSLLHDDVVDDASERRGRPAAHVRYGNAGAILTGDVCLARSVQVAAEEGGPRAVLELTRVVAAMSEGEVVQLLQRANLDLPRSTYLDIIERKSAALISWCAAAGAWSIQANAAADALVEYGAAVGVAFQITDDVLDYVGDPAKTGKQPGRDLIERKVTLPLLIAMERDPTLAPALRACDNSEPAIASLVERVVDTGAPEAALADARARVTGGIEALRTTLSDTPHRAALAVLAHHLVDRVR